MKEKEEPRAPPPSYRRAYEPPKPPPPRSSNFVPPPVRDRPNHYCDFQYGARQQSNLLRLDGQIFGQHIAVNTVLRTVHGHLINDNPKRALALHLVGSTGTGKSMLTSLVGSALFGTNAQHFVHLYNMRSDFPHSLNIRAYKDQIRDDIEHAVEHCERSIFIFDEFDKVPFGIVDELTYHIFRQKEKNNHFNKPIYIFITSSDGIDVNRRYHELFIDGNIREKLTFDLFPPTLSQLFPELAAIKVPFLPLEKKHVKQCIESTAKYLNIPGTRSVTIVQNVMGALDYFWDHYSVTGCKTVRNLVTVQKYLVPT